MADSPAKAKEGRAGYSRIRHFPVNSIQEAQDKRRCFMRAGHLSKLNLMVFPEPGSNIANHIKIRKGDMAKGWAESKVIIESLINTPVRPCSDGTS